MKQKTKTTFKMYAAWDYEFEEKEYNRMSEQGWQLINGGCFRQKYEYDDSVIYRYQIDYNKDIEDMARYEETFRDAGWERVNSTFNGWHVFRKVYDPSLPEEEYQIYTDGESRAEMIRRYRNSMIALCAINGINVTNGLRVLTENLPIGIGVAVIFALLYFMLFRGIFSLNRQLKGESNSRPFPMAFFLALLLPLAGLLLASTFFELFHEGSYFVMGFTAGLLLVAAVVIGAIVAVRNNQYRAR